MKTKFIDFEGIHGSGKTSSAWFLLKNMQNNNIKATASFEASIDEPREALLDFSFVSALSSTELENITNEFPAHRDKIMSIARKTGDFFTIYYPFFGDDIQLRDTLAKFGTYDGRMDCHEFKQLMVAKFTDFVEKALADDFIYIFENVIFQQTINELLRFSDASDEYIANFINELMNVLSPLNPVVFYLRPDDVKSTIDKIALERLSDNYDLYPDWIDWMVEYIKKSPYGTKFKVKERSGLLDYFYKRVTLEDFIYNSLNTDKQIIYVDKINKDAQNDFIYKEIATRL